MFIFKLVLGTRINLSLRMVHHWAGALYPRLVNVWSRTHYHYRRLQPPGFIPYLKISAHTVCKRSCFHDAHIKKRDEKQDYALVRLTRSQYVEARWLTTAHSPRPVYGTYTQTRISVARRCFELRRIRKLYCSLHYEFWGGLPFQLSDVCRACSINLYIISFVFVGSAELL